ncbi:cytochrome c oxidase assembly protein [Amycolatopsis sp.]|uniref:cytochrome c oxidase assembly protein n=1 Tax=Amycolatopsis sp. TaxID=37632 RepID=UPI002C1B1CE8|nr:cytochrome c oxidase assembly protein [Amycolatopsis sp.]HVV11999.1 cytochrome c oxidase assembly protein [Amycolatopsis sp.]
MTRVVRPVVLVVGLAVVVVVAVVAGASPYRAVGNADPGRLVAMGTPVLRLLVDVAAAVCLGSLAFVVGCTRPRDSGGVSAEAYRELRVATRAAIVWCAGSLLLVPFTAADTAGLPLPDVVGHLGGLLGAMEEPRAWLVTGLALVVVSVGCGMALRWEPIVVLFGLAVLAVLPPLMTGHGSSDVGHDWTLAALVIHVPAALVWLGALLVVVRRGRLDGPARHRYERLAMGCWLVLVASGAVLAVVLVPSGGWSSGYGLLLSAKAGIVAALGGAGFATRRRATQRPGLLGAELVSLAAVVALSVDLTHLPLPGFLGRAVTTGQTLLGYDLDGPPTLARLALDWRPDLFFASLAVALAAAYLVGIARLRRLSQRWPAGRTAAWLGGCLVLLVATSSGVGRYAAAMFSVHIASHMLVSMLAPALMVLGGPLTLLRAAIPPRGGLPGPRDWAELLGTSRLLRALTHPVVTLALFAGSPFALYLTGLFDAAARFHWAHMAINAWFLVVGYLFLWPLIGADRAPRPLPNLVRLGLLLAAMPADVVFGAVLMSIHRVIGNGPASAEMYQALALPWVPDLHADQRLAGLLALILGELALLVVLAALVARWDSREDAHVRVLNEIAVRR